MMKTKLKIKTVSKFKEPKINLAYELTIAIQEARMQHMDLSDKKKRITTGLKAISVNLTKMEVQRHESMLNDANKELKLIDEYMRAKGR